jgi:hypothetical protein
MYDSYVVSFNDDEIAERIAAEGVNDFSDIHFMNRVFVNEAGPYAVESAQIEITKHGFSYAEQTDEGYRSAEVRWCEDEDCDIHERSHRDVFAERMGY